MINTDVLNSLAANATFTDDAILIDVSAVAEPRSLILLISNFETHFAYWASVMDRKATIIKSGSSEVRIPASIAVPQVDMTAQEEPNRLLWFANVPISPAVLLVANELINNPRKAGITRLSDERQVIMSDGCNVLNPGHTLQEATNWARAQFWDAQDLADFRREVRQQGENVFEFTWKSFDPSDPVKKNDLQFTTRYKLFDGGDGHFYQLCENLGMRVIG